MITASNRKFLEQLVAKYAMQDFKAANPKPKWDRNGLPKRNPYSLSSRTNEAREMYAIACNENRTQEEEERCKAYILRHKLIEEES